MRDKRQGIALVSLVITIIVLLILAGVAVNIVINSDNILAKANQAKEGWNEKTANEYNALSVVLDTLGAIDSAVNPPSVPLSTDKLEIKKVTWTYNSESGKWEEDDIPQSDWYNYEEGRWANIKTINKETGNTAYWVWIPRYAYQVNVRPSNVSSSDNYVSNNPTYNIAFLQGTSNTPIDSSILNGASIKTDTSDGVETGDWVIHPAFDFGDTPLKGIWVAKFEASSSNPSKTSGGGNDPTLHVNVLPSLETNSVVSWRSIQSTNVFTVCQNMLNSGGSLEGLISSDPHMMKNVEWGAVAYLTQSIYGQMREGGNNQVWVNPTGSYKTGQAGEGPNVNKTTATDNYNTGNGPKASTTGNVYGIYDMSGGAFELVAGYIINSESSTSSNIENLRNAASKYVDAYEADNIVDPDTEKSEAQKAVANYNKLLNGNKMLKWGDALCETSFWGYNSSAAWQNDSGFYAYYNRFTFQRGGYHDDGAGSGMFYFCYNSGAAHANTGFRPVCVAPN